MFRDTISGLEIVFENEPPKGHVILVTGGPGTLKSAFVYNVMSNYIAAHPKECGTYMSLEERKDSHVRNMSSLGIKPNPRLHMYDFASLRTELESPERADKDSLTAGDYVDLILDKISKISRAKGERETGHASEKGHESKEHETKEHELTPACFALDSLNAFQSLARSDEQEFRDKTFEFFTKLKDTNILNFVIYEASEDIYRPEFYLVDGIIELGITKSAGVLKRYIQVRKMKSVRHSLEQFVIDITPNGLEIVSQMIR